MRDKVLVTGATGFVGSAVARRAQQDFAVRALVRPGSDRRNVAGCGFELVEGDMLDAASLERACEGVRYVFHVAADYRLWARDMREIHHNNRAGTANVMEAALRHGVERVVYTSSVATLDAKGASAPVDETRRLDEANAIGAYKRSKVAAERLVEGMVAERALPAVLVCPSTPIGPRDVKPTPTGRLIVEAASGRVPAFVDTGLNFVHVDDVAEAHLLALRHGVIGERYIAGGDDVALAELLGHIARMVGARPPSLRLPRWPLYPVALVAQGLAHYSGREPFLTVDGLRMSRNRMFFSSEKAKRELGYRPRSYLEGLRDALDWFIAEGFVRPR